MAVDKGAITDEHVLVVSVEHFPSSQSLSIDCYAEIRRWASWVLGRLVLGRSVTLLHRSEEDPLHHNKPHPALPGTGPRSTGVQRQAAGSWWASSGTWL